MLNEQDIEIRDSIDHLFRRHAGQMVSILVRHFGFENLDLIEDSVQDALVAAMKRWPFTGVPANPRAWLIKTAKNRVIDQLRRSGKSEPIEETFRVEKETETRFAGEIEEDELRMIFACCQPSISADAQVALTLKTVGGFNVSEIARAFLSNDEAVAKLLTRAKVKLRDGGGGLEIPAQDQLVERRDAVLKVLYLMFNEGYTASEGELLVRRDLCFEAIRLAHIVGRHPLTRSPNVHALVALFYFQAARLETRIDERGELLLLEDQDRSLWDKRLLGEGLRQFRLSASGDELSNYHLEAEIAAVHALASDFESTDWKRILECYDELRRRKFSPVVELNRLVAIEKLRGAESALRELESLAATHKLSNFNLFYITKAYLLENTGDRAAAIAELQSALALTPNIPVQRFVRRRLELLSPRTIANSN